LLTVLTREGYPTGKARIIYTVFFVRPFVTHFFVYSDEKGKGKMENRVALLGIVIENPDSVEKLNNILHKYSEYIIGRMGIPHRARNISIMSVAMDAPSDKISALSGAVGMLDGVSSKTIYSKLKENDKIVD